MVAACVVLLSVWGRVFFESNQELSAAQSAEATGALESALEHYQYAARWYTPGASAPQEALDALERLGTQARSDGRPELALKAFRRLRGALLATRGVLGVETQRLKNTNREIAELMADEQIQRADGSLRDRSRTQLVDDHLALLTIDPIPSRGWSLMVILSFGGWIVGVLMTIRRGLDRELKIQRQPLLRWGIPTIFAFGLWLFSLTQA